MGKKNKTIESSKHVWADFKKFITRGNILDMAVGVIMGSAFGAIVTALVNILLSLCTWAVPGGIKGLVTVLPAANAAQNGVATIGQQFAS
ncbi:MAG: MscL family protein, partial [Bacilli bacterium]